MKRIIFAAVIALASSASMADSWNSQKNVQAAVKDGITAYQKGGMAAVATAAANCMGGLDINAHTNRNVGRDVEYCIALEFTGLRMRVAIANPKQNVTYFDNDFNIITKWSVLLVEAGIVRTPEQLQPYLSPRMANARATYDNLFKE